MAARALPFLLLGSAIALAGCSGGGDDDGDEAGERMVRLLDDRFDPTTLSLSVGEEVEFVNEGGHEHTVTIHWVGDPPTVTKKDSEVEAGGETEHEFGTAGTYHVWCKYHGQMTSGMAMVVTVA